jgi:hypothetical protein
VQHGEEERCERGGAVVEAGGGHLKRAGSGAARLSLPGPQPTLLACLCCAWCCAFGSSARLLRLRGVGYDGGHAEPILCKSNGMRMFAARLDFSAWGSSIRWQQHWMEGHEKGIQCARGLL